MRSRWRDAAAAQSAMREGGRAAARSGEALSALVVGLIGVCWWACCATPGAAQDVVGFSAPDLAESFKVLRLEGNAVRWHKPTSGVGPVVTYRVLSGPQAFPGARNCRKMTALDALIAASDVAESALRQEIAAAFAMWEAVAGLSFREAGVGAPADILIGAQADPEGWAFADVFYDAASPELIKPISQALICLNPARRWKIGFDGDLRTYDLRYTLAHEIGHAIGLDHPNGPGQIMGYRYEERFRALQPGDVKGAVVLYGDRPRPGSTAERANVNQPPSSASRLAKRWGTRAFNARSQ